MNLASYSVLNFHPEFTSKIDLQVVDFLDLSDSGRAQQYSIADRETKLAKINWTHKEQYEIGVHTDSMDRNLSVFWYFVSITVFSVSIQE